ALPHRDRRVAIRGWQARQHIDLAADVRDDRRADEDGVEVFRTQGRHIDVRFEAIGLAAVAVALHADIQHTERWESEIIDSPGQQNEAGAGAPGRHAVLQQTVKRIEEAEILDKPRKSSALAARDHQAIEARQVGELAHLAYIGAKAAQYTLVLQEIAL